MKTERERKLEAALRDARPEIDSMYAGLYRSHVNPRTGVVEDENVAHELSELSALHGRIEALLADEDATGGDYSCAQCGTTDPQEHDADCMFGTGDSAPPQRREALEAFERLCQRFDVPDEPEYYTIYHALSEPAVPEAVRRLPDELEQPKWDDGVTEHAYVKGWNDCRDASSVETDMSVMRVPTINESADNQVERIRERLERAEGLLREAKGWCPQPESVGQAGTFSPRQRTSLRDRIDAHLSGEGG